MDARIEDRMQITDLITGWIYRDLGEWDRLRNLFYADGTIEVTWFEGRFVDFVDQSKQMGASDLRTKHLIGTPVVTFHGDKAIVETNAIIVAENGGLQLGAESHNRFYDTAEKRDGIWKLVRRQSVYDFGLFTFPCGVVEVDRAIVAHYPREYAALGYLLQKSGFPVKRVFATRGSQLERDMKALGTNWLTS